jgi:hypothetical protein
MQVTLEIPDSMAEKLGDSPNLVGRKFLEEHALNAYRTNSFTHFQVQQLLGFQSWAETETFLRSNGAPINYTLEDLEQDRATLDRLLGPV